ncbi:MAG: LysM peptidoglycan-binding domain-containing protein [Anaerolineae bacterium]|nr:LysM peptidoglycan-binding domain-containing protein [Anaerolineae bacterium]
MIETQLARKTTYLLIGLALLFTLGQPARAQDTSEPSGVTIHIVQDGDTLESIAESYGTTIQAIQQANALEDPRDIFVGQRLVIPVSITHIAAPSSQPTIMAGLADTLTALAIRYGTTPEQLGQSNRIVNPARLYAGQTITVPSTNPTGIARLGKNDSFWNIALSANANAVALATINNIANPFAIMPGNILVLPDDTTPSTGSPPYPWDTIVLHPLPLEPGQTGGIRITTSMPGTISATFLSCDLQFMSQETGHTAVFGIDRWTAPGLYPLTIDFQDEAGTTWAYNRDVLIVEGNYPREQIQVSEETGAVLNDAQSVQEEADYIAQKMSGFTPQQYWDGLFLLPVAGVPTSPFGAVRTYKGNEAVSFHTGTDLAIKTGTPFYAPADGIVVDTGWLDIRGYITLIDHGAGVYTGYWHQASIMVKIGDQVTAGQQIGTVGSTGLSTAAHLHWEMRVAGIQVDPMQWVREVFP